MKYLLFGWNCVMLGRIFHFQCGQNCKPQCMRSTSTAAHTYVVVFSIIVEEEKNCWIKSFIVFSLHTKSRFEKLWLNHWCHMDYFKDVPTMLLVLGTFQLHCCLWVRKLLDFIKNFLICVSEDEWRSYGFETPWGWVINDSLSLKYNFKKVWW